MKTFVEGANLSALAAKAVAHFAGRHLQLPDRVAERTFHVHEGTTGRNVQLQLGADAIPSLLARKPLRLRYSTQTPDGHLLEAVILAATPQDALRLASVFVRDLGIPKNKLTIVKEGTRRFHVVAGGIFRGLDREGAARLLSYMQPSGFAIPSAAAGNGHQQYYHAHLAKIVEAWQHLPPAVLEDHLRKNTPLGAHAQEVIDFLAANDHPLSNLGSCPPLLDHLRKDALRATFPPFDPTKSLDNPLVPVAGSIWLPEGLVAQAIPLGGAE